jgi:hypothetical protein
MSAARDGLHHDIADEAARALPFGRPRPVGISGAQPSDRGGSGARRKPSTTTETGQSAMPAPAMMVRVHSHQAIIVLLCASTAADRRQLGSTTVDRRSTTNPAADRARSFAEPKRCSRTSFGLAPWELNARPLGRLQTKVSAFGEARVRPGDSRHRRVRRRPPGGCETGARAPWPGLALSYFPAAIPA